MKKRGKYAAFGSLLFIAVLIVISLRFVAGGSEDSWICVNGSWINHGNPAAPRPSDGCGKLPGTEAVITVTGNLTKDNPGLEPGVWYIVSERPGRPAVMDKLSFDDNSLCTVGGIQSSCVSNLYTLMQRMGDCVRGIKSECTSSFFIVGERVTVSGIEKDGVIYVSSLIDDASSRALSSCPRWVNCMPGPQTNASCVVPPGCDGYTEKVY